MLLGNNLDSSLYHRLCRDIREFLVGSRDIANVLKIIRVFAVVVRDARTITPHTNRRTCRIAIALELLLAIFELGFLQLNNDIGACSLLLIEDDNVGSPLFSSKGYLIFDLYARSGVA